MKNFAIIKLEKSVYDYLVIATTYISPISTLNDVQNELQGITGSLIFDLTLINGTNSNRYISAAIRNGIVDRCSFGIVKNIEKNIKYKSMDFFCHNTELVENGTIPKALKILLLAGEYI